MFSVFIVMMDGNPAKRRAFLNEDKPPHADMLRYDRAFADPADESRIVIPRFRGYANTVTYGRWRSFGLDLKTAVDTVESIHDWFTYVHDATYTQLIRKTFDEYVAEHKVKLAARQ